MIRVCHIISGDLWAGAEVMTYHLLQALKKYKDLELFVILLNDGQLATEIRRLGIPVEVMDETDLSSLRILWRIRRKLMREYPDVVHSHRYKENILAYLASKTMKGVQLIGTLHGMPEPSGRRTKLKTRIATRLNSYVLSRYFRNVVAVSEDIRRALVGHHRFPERKVEVIHNGVAIPEGLTAKEDKSTFVIGSSGRLFPVKDYPLMVDIAEIISKRTDGIRFELAGDGPERTKIQELIQKYGLKSVFQLRGSVNNMSTFYQGLDLYLNTSVHEGVPMSVLEAMAHGLPVVAPRVGGLKEILEDGVQGYLVDGRDPKDFAERCLELYENKPLRRQMALAARQKVVKEFSVDQMAEKYYLLYHELARCDGR